MKNFTKLICIVLMLLMCSQSAFAASVSVNASYDGEKLTLTGETLGNTTVKILPYGMAESEVNAGVNPTDIDFFTANGNYTYIQRMPDWVPAGKYNAYVINNTGSAVDSFVFYRPSVAASLLPSLSGDGDSLAKYDIIAGSAADLGIDSVEPDYAAFGKKAAQIVYAKGVGINPQDVPGFNKSYYAAIALAAMEGKEADDTKAYLKKYANNLGIDIASDYEMNPDEMKSDILYLYANTDFVDELKSIKALDGNLDFSQMCSVLYDRLEALSAVRENTGGPLNLEKLYKTDYNALLGSILTSNSSYTEDNSEAVFNELADSSKYTFNKFSDLESNFDSAVDAVTEDSGSSGNNKKPGGNSGGNSNGSYSVPSDSVNKADDYEADLNPENSSSSGSVSRPVSYKMPSLSAVSASYYDLPADHWAAQSVSVLGGNGIISGYEDGSYRPDNSITRAEFAKLVISAFSVNAAEINDFSDVASTDWYAPFVAKAAGSGLITGYEGIFNPNGNISRQDAALILYRMASLAGVVYLGNANFADINDIDVYAITAVRGLANASIISGDSNYRFNPKNNLSRAEAAKLLYGLINDMAVKLDEGGK